LPRRLSIVHPRSACPACGRPISWHDNVPVLSYLILRGRCRHCRTPISPRYPLVETATALLFALLFAKHGPTPPFVVQALVSSAPGSARGSSCSPCSSARARGRSTESG